MRHQHQQTVSKRFFIISSVIVKSSSRLLSHGNLDILSLLLLLHSFLLSLLISRFTGPVHLLLLLSGLVGPVHVLLLPLLLPPEPGLPAPLLLLGSLGIILLPAFLLLLLSQRILVPLVAVVAPPSFRLEFTEVSPR